MIRVYRKGEDYSQIFNRNQLNFDKVNTAVAGIIEDVKARGDAALLEYAEKFDNSSLSSLIVSDEEIERAYLEVDSELLASLRRAKENVLAYHKKQMISDFEENVDGKRIGWTMRPVGRAGIYVPGGTAAYPSSVLMTALPAVAAGVKEIYMTTPAKNDCINPLTIVAAKECGVTRIYKIGGAQAIAALAFGSESVKKVDVIAGPGNIYVTVAKKLVYGYVGIDMIAGPSEILIIADETANPVYLAADMLSQAEHDALATSILLTTSQSMADRVRAELEIQLAKLPRADIAKAALKDNSAIIVCESIDRAIEICNRVAPEHLELCFENARESLGKIQNAGAVFIGNYSPEPLGDYFAGPNHVLPTSGTAKYFSVLNVMVYLKRISVIEYTGSALAKVADDVIRLAECEGLSAHANSIRVRK